MSLQPLIQDELWIHVIEQISYVPDTFPCLTDLSKNLEETLIYRMDFKTLATLRSTCKSLRNKVDKYTSSWLDLHPDENQIIWAITFCVENDLYQSALYLNKMSSRRRKDPPQRLGDFNRIPTHFKLKPSRFVPYILGCKDKDKLGAQRYCLDAMSSSLGEALYWELAFCNNLPKGMGNMLDAYIERCPVGRDSLDAVVYRHCYFDGHGPNLNTHCSSAVMENWLSIKGRPFQLYSELCEGVVFLDSKVFEKFLDALLAGTIRFHCFAEFVCQNLNESHLHDLELGYGVLTSDQFKLFVTSNQRPEFICLAPYLLKTVNNEPKNLELKLFFKHLLDLWVRLERRSSMAHLATQYIDPQKEFGSDQLGEDYIWNFVIKSKSTNDVFLCWMLKAFDPSKNNQRALIEAISNHNYALINSIVGDRRIDLHSSDHKAVKEALKCPDDRVLKMFLRHSKLDLTLLPDLLCDCIDRNWVQIVKTLLKDSKIDPSSFNLRALRKAIDNNSKAIVDLLLKHPKIATNVQEIRKIGMDCRSPEIREMLFAIKMTKELQLQRALDEGNLIMANLLMDELKDKQTTTNNVKHGVKNDQKSSLKHEIRNKERELEKALETGDDEAVQMVMNELEILTLKRDTMEN